MELFLLYAMGLTIVAFFSIVMASPKVLPVAGHGSDNESNGLTPTSSEDQGYNNPNQESVTPETSQEVFTDMPMPNASNEENI